MKKIIVKYLEGNALLDEQNSLLRWIRIKENRNAFKKIKNEWISKSVNEPYNELHEYRWFKLQQNIAQAASANALQRKFNIFRFAATVLILISVSAAGYFYTQGLQPYGKVLNTEVITGSGQISKTILPDGSGVWLNAASKITYNSQFGISNRDISLKGEAFFNVTKNANLPFEVDVDLMKVKVLGTQFCVSNYEEAQNVDVILEKGSVQISFPLDSKSTMQLKPNELARFDKIQRIISKSEINPKYYTSWRNGIVHFFNVPLNDLVVKLNKRYNQKFEVEEGVKDVRFTFSIVNEDLNDVIQIIEKVSFVNANYKNNVVYFSQK